MNFGSIIIIYFSHEYQKKWDTAVKSFSKEGMILLSSMKLNFFDILVKETPHHLLSSKMTLGLIECMSDVFKCILDGNLAANVLLI